MHVRVIARLPQRQKSTGFFEVDSSGPLHPLKSISKNVEFSLSVSFLILAQHCENIENILTYPKQVKASNWH